MKLLRIDETKIEEFRPRIPKSAPFGEDHSIRRVCLAETAEGAVRSTGLSIELPGGEPRQFWLSEWEVEGTEEWLVRPETLYYNELVSDALETREWWSLKTLVAEPRKITFTSSGKRDSYFAEVGRRMQIFDVMVAMSKVPTQRLQCSKLLTSDELLNEWIPEHLDWFQNGVLEVLVKANLVHRAKVYKGLKIQELNSF